MLAPGDSTADCVGSLGTCVRLLRWVWMLVRSRGSAGRFNVSPIYPPILSWLGLVHRALRSIRDSGSPIRLRFDIATILHVFSSRMQKYDPSSVHQFRPVRLHDNGYKYRDIRVYGFTEHWFFPSLSKRTLCKIRRAFSLIFFSCY